jgi:hypothetical protein
MSVKTIPASIVHTCDVCKVEHSSVKRYHNDTPPDWMLLRITSNGNKLSYSGDPVEKLLCTGCGERTMKAIEAVEPG